MKNKFKEIWREVIKKHYKKWKLQRGFA